MWAEARAGRPSGAPPPCTPEVPRVRPQAQGLAPEQHLTRLPLSGCSGSPQAVSLWQTPLCSTCPPRAPGNKSLLCQKQLGGPELCQVLQCRPPAKEPRHHLPVWGLLAAHTACHKCVVSQPWETRRAVLQHCRESLVFPPEIRRTVFPEKDPLSWWPADFSAQQL